MVLLVPKEQLAPKEQLVLWVSVDLQAPKGKMVLEAIQALKESVAPSVRMAREASREKMAQQDREVLQAPKAKMALEVIREHRVLWAILVRMAKMAKMAKMVQLGRQEQGVILEQEVKLELEALKASKVSEERRVKTA